MDNDWVRLEPFFGRVEIQTRMRPLGNRLIGEGRSLNYDGNGNLINDSGWQPTGAELYWDDPDPCKWWEFWK